MDGARGECVITSYSIHYTKLYDGLHLVDSPEHKTYGDNSELIWKGLDIINYMIVPHYRSSHFESEEMEKVVQYMIENKVLFIALKDGEVIIIE